MELLLHCPTCHRPISYRQKDFSKGTHHEQVCPNCGRFLQWDQPAAPMSNMPVGSAAFGPPQACDHPADRRTQPTGSVPYLKSS